MEIKEIEQADSLERPPAPESGDGTSNEFVAVPVAPAGTIPVTPTMTPLPYASPAPPAAGRGGVVVTVVVLAAIAAVFFFFGSPLRDKLFGASNPEQAKDQSSEEGADPFKVEGDAISFPASAAKRMGLETDTVTTQHVPITLRLTGRTGLNAEKVAHVRGQFPGRVLEIGPPLGAVVYGPESPDPKTGQPTTMCVVESTDLAQAKSDFVKAKVTLDVDTDAAKRTKQLVDEKVLADKFLLDAESTVKKDQADFDATRQKLLVFGLKDEDLLNITRQQGKERMVYAIPCPKSGIITEKNVMRGELADPSVNLFTIADLSTIWIWGDVYERDRRRVHEGQTMKVIVASHPDEPRECKVEWVSPVLDSTTRSIRIRGSLDNHDGRLLADMYCTILLVVDDKSDSIILPIDAVVRKNDTAYVFVRERDTDPGAHKQDGLQHFVRREVKVESVGSGIGFESDPIAIPPPDPVSPQGAKTPGSPSQSQARTPSHPASSPARSEDSVDAKLSETKAAPPERLRVISGLEPGDTVVVRQALGLFAELEQHAAEAPASPDADSQNGKQPTGQKAGK